MCDILLKKFVSIIWPLIIIISFKLINELIMLIKLNNYSWNNNQINVYLSWEYLIMNETNYKIIIMSSIIILSFII
jgi:hypothetical protein